MEEQLEFVRLAAAELDDQAICEIRRLAALDGERTSADHLLELVGNQRAIVARRACGAAPEIIGLAAALRKADGQDVDLVVLDPAFAGQALEAALGRRLIEVDRPSLFLRRAGSPLGLSGPV